MPSSSSLRALALSLSHPSIRGTVSMFCAMVWCGNRPICWMT